METIGIFIQGTTAVGVLVLAILTFMGRSTNVLREDIASLRGDVKELRTEMNVKFSEVWTEIHNMHTRLGRVEGHLRISDDHQVDR